MALTPDQITAINTQLSVDLATVAADRLIELCLLYRSAPSVKPAFLTALNNEITRRFTAAEIAANDVMFSVIQNFSNQFNSEKAYKEKLYEFVNTLDRNLWISQNISFFEATLLVPERVQWLVNETAVFNAIFLSEIALTKLINSTTAMTAVAESSTAMTAIAGSSIALAAIVVSTTTRNALMNNNAIFQSVRQNLFNTVSANWFKQAGAYEGAYVNSSMDSVNSAVASPQGFVFASLGFANSGTQTECKHPDGTIARQAGTSNNPVSLANLDVVSFNGAKFTARVANVAQVYAELWIPPTI